MLASKILKFLQTLEIKVKLPAGVEILNPYQHAIAWSLCEQFYHKFYADPLPRTLILGINPGRFGGGVTGIPFTDPIKLENFCGINNDLVKKNELSANFIYQMIDAFGGPEKFYQRFYISSVSPLGFTLAGKNLNYYDIRELEEKLTPFIIECLKTQLQYGLLCDTCYCLGEGDNYKFLVRLNEQEKFFKKIIPLAHPRFIMQYKRKTADVYIADYLRKLSSTSL